MVSKQKTNLGILSLMKEAMMQKLVNDVDSMKIIANEEGISTPAVNALYNTIFPWKKTIGTTTDNKTYVSIEIEVPGAINCAVKAYYVHIYVMVHDSLMRFDKNVAASLGIDERGTRLDVLCDKIDWLMNGSLDLGFDKVELKRCPTFEPADGYHGRMLEYYVEGWNRWGEKL